MKHFFLLIITLLIFSLQQGVAQSEETEGAQTYRPRLAFKVSPLSLIDYTPTIQMGLEIGTTQNQALHIDYGYITDLYRNRNFSGFKLKGEYRFYEAMESEPNVLKFWGLQYMYKHVEDPTSSFIWRNNNTYQELISYTVLNRVNSIFAVGGFVFNAHKPIGFECSFGLGYRRFEVSLKDVPEDANVTWNNNRNIFQPSGPGVFQMPGIFFNWRVVWRIR